MMRMNLRLSYEIFAGALNEGNKGITEELRTKN